MTITEDFLDISDGKHSVDQRWFDGEPYVFVWDLFEDDYEGRHRFSSIPLTSPVRFMVGNVLVREVL